MKEYPFLDLKVVNAPFEDEIREAVCSTISSGWYILGAGVKRFECELAKLCKTRHAIGTSNGLDALRLIMRAYIEMGIMTKGDEIIVPGNTYIASILAITDNDLIPVFVEPDPATLNIDITKIEQHITPKTRGIMVVHLYGSPCWSQELNDIATNHNIKIIEDNAQAIGATAPTNGLNGSTTTGGLGDAAGLSFYPTKNLGALGDAGAVTTNDAKLANTIRALLNYGSDYRYHNIYAGYNCRMDEMQAAILLAKLPYLSAENIRRHQLAVTYNSCISNPNVITPTIFDNCTQVWHQYVLCVNRRDAFRKHMLEHGVSTDILYPTPPHLQPCYWQYKDLHLPITVSLSNEVVCLPISSLTSEQDAREISEIVNMFKP
ncbi:MAG: DegT/DnrJ/EryC1/StrS family aminotransferase [Muribaculaceae bacterium]